MSAFYYLFINIDIDQDIVKEDYITVINKIYQCAVNKSLKLCEVIDYIKEYDIVLI